MIGIRKEQACRFLLVRNGLLGSTGLRGKAGVLAYIAQAGCVQYDPIDVCGKSHELTLLSRVKGFTREMLDELLYQDRALIDFFDKNMCIMRVEDWPCLSFLRESFRRNSRSRDTVEPVAEQILDLVHEKGSLSAQELDMKEKVDWSWNATSLGRAALETLYFRGDLVIHHKTGAHKNYALASDCLPKEILEKPAPFRHERERQMWQMMRRISAIGMLWNASSDAWLGVEGLTAQIRNEIFDVMLRQGRIVPVAVEGVSQPLFVLAGDIGLLRACCEPLAGDRTARLLAPLDCMLWDRRLIYELFGFSYKWEIYTPQEQRKYGYYVLPVLMGERFVGRVEPVCDRESGTLIVKHFWPEDGVKVNDRFLWALEDALQGLKRFNGMNRIVWDMGWLAEG